MANILLMCKIIKWNLMIVLRQGWANFSASRLHLEAEYVWGLHYSDFLKDFHFGSASDFWVFEPKIKWSLKNKSLYFNSALDFWSFEP